MTARQLDRLVRELLARTGDYPMHGRLRAVRVETWETPWRACDPRAGWFVLWLDPQGRRLVHTQEVGDRYSTTWTPAPQRMAAALVVAWLEAHDGLAQGELALFDR